VLVPEKGERLRHSERMRRKLIGFDEETWQAIDLLARDSMKSWQELADEAFRDLLKKHGRPTDLRTALRQSAKTSETNKTRAKTAVRRKGTT
jgi:hypothetical protein